MKTPNQRSLIVAVAAMVVSQLACQTLFPPPATPTLPATVAPSATATDTPIPLSSTPDPHEPLPFSAEEIRNGIQQSLDLYAEALTDNKPDLLLQVVDQENKPFRRIVRSRFDDFQASYVGGQIDFDFSLLDITRREYGFVIARFTSGGSEAAWPFRYLDGNWVISEPSTEQIGEAVITEIEHFSVTSYPWADDVNSEIIAMLETARDDVETVLGKVPTEKPKVEIFPIYGLRQFDSMQAIASYSQGATPTEDRILIYAPHSFIFSFYDSELGWQRELQDVITHEYTHLTHARSFDGAGKLADWMSEGLAEYVSGQEYNSYVACEAVQMGTFIPILDETRAYNKQDLMHMYSLTENFGLSYDFATSLVEFTVENHGGLDGFWKLANEFDKTSDFKKAVPQALGVSYDQYDQQWQAWLKKQC